MILGVDPGVSSGALSVINAPVGSIPRFVAVIDIPTHGEKAKKRVDVRSVLAFLQTYQPQYAFIERAQAMPEQGSSSGFLYGRGVGALETCVEGMQIPLQIIESSAWKKTHGLIGTGKKDSRQCALRHFPDAASQLTRELDHDRAEALLIARHGMILLRG